MPDYEDPIKKDLADIAEKMSALKTDAETRMNRKYSDSADYFTLWAHQIKTPIAAMRLLLQTDYSSENDELEEQLFKIEQYVEWCFSTSVPTASLPTSKSKATI